MARKIKTVGELTLDECRELLEKVQRCIRDPHGTSSDIRDNIADCLFAHGLDTRELFECAECGLEHDDDEGNLCEACIDGPESEE